MNLNLLFGVFIVACTGAPTPPAEHAGAVEELDLSRGRWRVRTWRASLGPDSAKRWSEITLDGLPYQPLAQPFTDCSLDPTDAPAALTAVAYTPEGAGLYLIALRDGQVVLEKISDKPYFSGRWVAEGSGYALENVLITPVSGARRALPTWQGELIDAAPDASVVLSALPDPAAGQLTLQLTGAPSVVVARTTLPCAREAWEAALSHPIPGTVEGANRWLAERVSWTQNQDGSWSIHAPPSLESTPSPG